jgi:hypothetical protein
MKTGFLEEAPGNSSFVRLQSLLMTVLFMAVTLWQTYHGHFDFEILLLLAAFATGPKVVQKFVESKTEINKAL